FCSRMTDSLPDDMGARSNDASFMKRPRLSSDKRGRTSVRRRSGVLLLVRVRDFLELGVDHAVIGRLALGVAFSTALLGGVHGLAQLHRSLSQGIGLLADSLGIR